MLTWFDQRSEFMAAVASVDESRRVGEAHIAAKTEFDGYCSSCRAVTTFLVQVGGRYGDRPNLREGMVCNRCRLSNRNRLVFHALTEQIARVAEPRVALLERLTPLYNALAEYIPDVTGSEYLGENLQSGRDYPFKGYVVRHESITAMSYANASFDVLGHCDVLEHVYDFRAALAEVRRVLRPGGQMICTVPFFMTRDAEAVLAKPRADGSTEFFGPPEYHGDGLRPEGILTYHHFGWHLLDDVRRAGFSSAHIGLNFDLFCGYATNNHSNFDYGLMYPLVLRAIA